MNGILRFSSPSHDALYANGDPKVVNYRVLLTAADDPNSSQIATAVYPKAFATPVPNTYEYAINVTALLVGLGDVAGFAFIRAESPQEVGAWGTSTPFLLTLPPAACNAVSLT